LPDDKFGYPMWYPTSSGGLVVESPKDPGDSRYIYTDGPYSLNSDGSWTTKDHDNFRPRILSDPNFDSIGCDMDLQEAIDRGYGWKQTDFGDMEMKFAIKITGGGSDDGDSITVGTPTGRHSGNHCNEGTAYYAEFSYAQNPFAMRFGKEEWHSSYDWKDWIDLSSVINDKLSGLGRYVGLGIVKYNKTNNQGKVTVVVEAYVNPDPDANKKDWRKVAEIEDKGGWNGPILTQKMPVDRIKISDATVSCRIKNWSFREIDPIGFGGGGGGGGEGEPPPAPSGPSFGFAEFKNRRHINYEGTSACSAGSGSNLVTLYEVTTQNNSSSLTGTGWRAGEWFHKPSALNEAIIISGKVYAKKNGSGATLYLRIRKSTDDSIARELASWTASAINTTETELTFNDTGNTYRLKGGDKICLESDGSSSNNIAVYRDSVDRFDGTNSERFTKDGTSASYVIKTGDLKATLNGIL
jgi:hypothetical protein